MLLLQKQQLSSQWNVWLRKIRASSIVSSCVSQTELKSVPHSAKKDLWKVLIPIAAGGQPALSKCRPPPMLLGKHAGKCPHKEIYTSFCLNRIPVRASFLDYFLHQTSLVKTKININNLNLPLTWKHIHSIISADQFLGRWSPFLESDLALNSLFLYLMSLNAQIVCQEAAATEKQSILIPCNSKKNHFC